MHFLSPQYSLVNALHMQGLCQLAYALPHEMSERWRLRVFDTAVQAGYDEAVAFDLPGGVQGFLAYHPAYLVAVFRGSEERADWFSNAKTVRNSFDVHRGFAGLAETALEFLRPLIEQDHRPLYLAGHSQGGALATLVADPAAFGLPYLPSERVQGVYTFGCPRIGGAEFQARYRFQEITWRHVNNSDIVPRIPLALPEKVRTGLLTVPGLARFAPLLSRLPGGYRHVGRLLYFDVAGKLHQSPGWLFRAADVLRGLRADLGRVGLASFEDHQISAYGSAIASSLSDAEIAQGHVFPGQLRRPRS